MVARPSERQSSWNAGELDPKLAGRVDIKQYYSAGLTFLNVEPVPQSGFRQSAGSWDAGPIRGRVSELAQSAVSVTAGPHTGSAVVWECDVAGSVCGVQLSAIAADTDTHTLNVEVETGAGWAQLGTLDVAVDQTAKNVTFAVAPGEGVAAVTGVRVMVAFSSAASVGVGTVKVLTESATQDSPRYQALRHDSGLRYNLSVSAGWLDIFEDDAWAAGVYLSGISTSVLPEIGFYVENATVGIFHRTIELPMRVRRAGSSAEWWLDDWPYENIPTADLGGTYTKTDDVWQIFIRWTGGSTDYFYMSASVDGQQTPAIKLKSPSTGDPVQLSATLSDMDWDTFGADLQTALRALSSLSDGVTVSVDTVDFPAPVILSVTFGGDLSGSEYQFETSVTSTTAASALPVHSQPGKTDYEPIISATQGGVGVVGLVQDRLAYGDFQAVPAAIAMSEPAEYFNLDDTGTGASAARLDKLRAGQTAERVLAFKEATYFLVFTDRGVHFASNRTINATDPLDYTITSETGIVAYTDPVSLDGKVYYLGQPDEEDQESGHQVLSLDYSELETRFDANPESLLASHLIVSAMRSKKQVSSGDSDAAKVWILRSDGLLVAAQIIKSQDILGFSRWQAASGGAVREIQVDGRNRLRMAVARGGLLRHERQDPALFLQAALTATCNLAGQVSGLDIHEGREVWAVAPSGGDEPWVIGPYTVASGAIDLGEYYSGDIVVGLWQAPKWESMPRYRILPDDEILMRPGRIHSARIEVIDTTSIAVGANGGTPKNVPLARFGDAGDGPTPAANRRLDVSGMLGMVEGTTLVITQTRPGRLQVRDINLGEKL